MFRPRVIPVLLLKNSALVKSIRFRHHKYIGDPINAVRIFNDLKADELVFLDIDATRENRLISLDFVRNVGEEANMPFAVGGGIKTLEDIRAVINAGAERVVIGTHAAEDPDFIRSAAETFGSTTIIVCIDVKTSLFRRRRTRIMNGTRKTKYSPEEFAGLMQTQGAGELIIQSIDRDGMMQGYDIELIRTMAAAVELPIIALGGAATAQDLAEAFTAGHANGLAAGSMFVYQSTNRGVLINYPGKDELLFDTDGRIAASAEKD